MIKNIRAEFELTITQVDWMDKESQQKATDKAVAIDTKIGYPEFTYNKTHLDSLYSKVSFFIRLFVKFFDILTKNLKSINLTRRNT